MSDVETTGRRSGQGCRSLPFRDDIYRTLGAGDLPGTAALLAVAAPPPALPFHRNDREHLEATL